LYFQLTLLAMGPYYLVKTAVAIFFHSDTLSESPKSIESWSSFASLDLERIKRVRRAFGCKFNDVLVALFGNVLGRYLMDELPGNEKFPDKIYFSCPREVPNRPTGISNYL
jgi:hypothetical protein